MAAQPPLMSKTFSSIIQGISQQDVYSRGEGSAEDQVNCLNEVLDGVVSRMGSRTVAALGDTEWDEPFVHDIIRSRDEQYVVLIEEGVLRIFNKETGAPATITGNINAYLTHTGTGRKSFQAVTVGDTTFLLNKERTPAMDATTAAARGNKAIAHFKAGAYSTLYSLSITLSLGGGYTFNHTSVDNTAPADAANITTRYLAATFRNDFFANGIPALEALSGGNWGVAIYGSTMVITAPPGVSFNIQTTDGAGDRQFVSFIDTLKTLADLPAKAETNYQASISDNGGEASNEFFLKYVGGTNTGRWTEVVAPSTPTTINDDTMPHRIVNTGVNTFTVSKGPWGRRVAGDGINTAMDPSFIGQPCNSLQFIGGRLAMVSEYQVSASKARNAYVFFPDTVQTDLDTAPIDYDVSNGSSVAITHAVVAGGKLQFWGDKAQTYLDSGQDPIREDTTDVLPLANYEFDGEVAPQPIGLASLLFGTEVGAYSRVTEVYFRGGQANGEIAITAHVPKLLPGKMRQLAIADASSKLFALTEGNPNLAYIYQWYNQGTERVQSAWNPWSFPAPSKIIWMSALGDKMYAIFKWGTICTLEHISLDREGHDVGAPFPIRLDHLLSEEWGAHNGIDGYALTLPYIVPSDKRSTFMAVERLDMDGVSQRGRQLDVVWVSETAIKVVCPPDHNFYFGSLPTARRKASRFIAKDRNGEVIFHDKLTITDVVTSHNRSTQYDVVVTYADGTSKTETFVGRVLGDPTLLNNQVPTKTGTFSAKVGAETEEVSIELVNNTVFPCVWTGMKFIFDLTERKA